MTFLSRGDKLIVVFNIVSRCNVLYQLYTSHYWYCFVMLYFAVFVLSAFCELEPLQYVIMGALASQINSLTIVYSTVYSDAYQRKHLSSASLAFVWGIHRGPVNSTHKWPVNAENISLWWCHHAMNLPIYLNIVSMTLARTVGRGMDAIYNTPPPPPPLSQSNLKLKCGEILLT